jgi:hypothetical protein
MLQNGELGISKLLVELTMYSLRDERLTARSSPPFALAMPECWPPQSAQVLVSRRDQIK